MKTQEQLNQMEFDSNYPGGAYFDGENYYNAFGQQLRDIEEYNQYSEGYTPFGDE